MGESSYRQILRSVSIIGGASVLNIVIGLGRTKVAALLLGPAGIGMIGLLQNLIGTAATLSALGFSVSGTRQIADARRTNTPGAIAAARRALTFGALILGALGAVVFWALRAPLASTVLKDPAWAGQIGWASLAVALTVVAGGQVALMNGYQRLGDMARVSVSSAILSTILGVGALLLWRQNGLLPFVIAMPFASVATGLFYLRRARYEDPDTATPLRSLIAQWRVLVTIGLAFMVAGLVSTGGLLVVRTFVRQELGTTELGCFQAAWTISMTYVGVVVSAMGTDYYPRLTAAIKTPGLFNRLVNEQSEVSLLIAAPIFLAILGAAPWVIDLLYSSRFREAAEILRWQVLGDILKMASFPLGYVLLAAGSGRVYVAAELASIAVFTTIVWFGLSRLGLQITGVGVLGMYALYLPCVYWAARAKTGFRWTPQVKGLLASVFTGGMLIHLLAARNELVGVGAGTFAALLFAVHSSRRLARLEAYNVKAVQFVHTVLAKVGLRGR